MRERRAIEAGKLDALVAVLLHEATRIVDASLRITPDQRPGGRARPGVPAGAFVEGVWSDRLTPAPRYREPMLGRTRFQSGGRVLPIDQAESVYTALRRTPFVSLSTAAATGTTTWPSTSRSTTWPRCSGSRTGS